MNITRRGALGLLFAAPAIVKVGSLMPVKVIRPEPKPIVAYIDAGNGWHHYFFEWDERLGATVVYRDGLVIKYAFDTGERPGVSTRSLWKKESVNV